MVTKPVKGALQHRITLSHCEQLALKTQCVCMFYLCLHAFDMRLPVVYMHLCPFVAYLDSGPYGQSPHGPEFIWARPHMSLAPYIPAPIEARAHGALHCGWIFVSGKAPWENDMSNLSKYVYFCVFECKRPSQILASIGNRSLFLEV